MIRHTVDENFFKTWTRESAWTYGWLLTDGSVEEKSGQIRVMLKSIDRDVLEKMKHVMLFSGPIYDGEQRDGRKFSYLRVCRKGMAEDLFSLGMARTDKTFNTVLPDVPDKVFWDLMRGIFEGDGSIRHRTGNTNVLEITIAGATKQFMYDLQSALERRGIFMRMYTRKPGVSGSKHEMHTLTTRSNEDALRLCYFMYANTNETIRMNRKFNVYVNYIRDYYDRKRRSASCGELVELAYQNIPEISEMDAVSNRLLSEVV
ncbi:LAGLIDADG family homing endonuclease [Aneurinibacillus aneurinilyticus]|uniref:LAGLIDADG family homing endonuclease n=1 Tax=Aneurinibacillus aneurinilyticus TaxID=1391 RepID=UPI0023F2FD7F|nr:LAGLIDADG family homing endonuclease [Aneurinibacillus aneurinilyticus]